VGEPVKKRAYHAPRRREAAEQTRAAVLRAARDLFTRNGFEATSVAAVARAAGVSVDTVYASVGRKPQLLLAVHDMALAGGDDPVDAEQRDYVRRVRAVRTAAEKIAVYAEALAVVLPKTVPLLASLREAGRSDPACAQTYRAVSRRRAANMRRFAADLRATGELRTDLTDDDVADLVWSTNGPEYFLLLQDLGYTPDRVAALLRDVWTRTLLADPATR
jgi:AcrR family transcriptional regulator